MLHKHWNHQTIDTSNHYFVTMVSNPIMYESRYVLYDRFKEQFQPHKLITVEVAYGDRPFEITNRSNGRHLQLRTKDELWHKENALNLGVQYLSVINPEWEYVTFIDADVLFTYERVEEKIVHELQLHKIIQPWSDAVDLGPHDEPLKVQKSFLYNWVHNTPERVPNGYYYCGKRFWGHPGYALSMRREAYEALGGLFDYSILGSGDHNMCASFIGEVRSTHPSFLHKNYKQLLLDYEERAIRFIDYNLGYVKGGLQHLHHGPKRNRFYTSRWGIFDKHAYDPLTDIKRDSHGLWKLDCSWKLRNAIKAYFRARNEDLKLVD